MKIEKNKRKEEKKRRQKVWTGAAHSSPIVWPTLDHTETVSFFP
jgi:hypothetical protein